MITRLVQKRRDAWVIETESGVRLGELHRKGRKAFVILPAAGSVVEKIKVGYSSRKKCPAAPGRARRGEDWSRRQSPDRLLYDLDDAVRAGIDEHDPIVHAGVAISAHAVGGGDLIIGYAT